MARANVDRRRFLQSTGLATVAVATGGLGVAPGFDARAVWAATRIISPSQAATLVVMARHLFPHYALGDQYYAAAVQALDEQAATDPKLAAQLVEGVAKLDEAMGIPFTELSAGNQLTVIESLEGTPFFNSVRAATLAALYTNDTVARAFGFEGSSVEYGGYINRGFDDLGWLPVLPDNA
jgi:hypothetical protein